LDPGAEAPGFFVPVSFLINRKPAKTIFFPMSRLFVADGTNQNPVHIHDQSIRCQKHHPEAATQQAASF
jgi:hypothetical protein